MLLALNYHRIARVEPGGDFWGLAVSPENFASHLEVLTRHFEIVDARSASLAVAAGAPGVHVLVTFDDGYADTLHEALPALQRQKVPALVFLASGYVGRTYFWWDAVEAMFRTRTASGIAVDEPRLRATWEALRDQSPVQRDLVMRELLHRAGYPVIAPDCRPLTEAEVTELASCPLISFGGHTRWHPWLPSLPPEQMAEEITAGKLDKEVLTGQRQVGFAFPFGATNADTQQAVVEAGFTLAFTTSPPKRGGEFRDLLSHPRVVVGNWEKEYFGDCLRNLCMPGEQNAQQ